MATVGTQSGLVPKSETSTATIGITTCNFRPRVPPGNFPPLAVANLIGQLDFLNVFGGYKALRTKSGMAAPVSISAPAIFSSVPEINNTSTMSVFLEAPAGG